MTQPSSSELLVRQRLTALARSLVGAHAGDRAAIHQARVATRRLRETLPLLARGRKAQKLERRVRRLTRALGPVRELDVALQTLDELETAADVPRAAVHLLRQLILSERSVMHAEARKAIDRCDMSKLRRKTLAALHEPSSAARRRGIAASRHAASVRRAARRAAGVRSAIDNAASIYLPDRLHEVRIAVKKLRYAIEVASHVSSVRGRRPSSTATSSLRTAGGKLLALRRAQDLLGRMHDLEVLIARTRAVQASSGAPNLRLSGDLDSLVRRMETECRLLHGQYMASRAVLLDICERVEMTAERAA